MLDTAMTGSLLQSAVAAPPRGGRCRHLTPPGFGNEHTRRRRLQRRRQLQKLKEGTATLEVPEERLPHHGGRADLSYVKKADPDPGTAYAIKMVQNYIDLKADLDLLPSPSQPVGTLALEDIRYSNGAENNGENQGHDSGDGNDDSEGRYLDTFFDVLGVAGADGTCTWKQYG